MIQWIEVGFVFFKWKLPSPEFLQNEGTSP